MFSTIYDKSQISFYFYFLFVNVLKMNQICLRQSLLLKVVTICFFNRFGETRYSNENFNEILSFSIDAQDQERGMQQFLSAL